MNLDIFRAYDIRGIFGVDFEPNDFYQIARAYDTWKQAGNKVSVGGRSVRLTSCENQKGHESPDYKWCAWGVYPLSRGVCHSTVL